jgi:hypothetical protein
MDTDVPPLVVPKLGLMEVIVGRMYVKPLTLVTEVPLELVMTTSTLPAAWGGVVAEINVSLADTFVAATPPTVTVVPCPKPEPETLRDVPPPVVPELGLMEVIVGKTYVNPFVLVPLAPLGFITTTSTLPAAWGGVVAKIDVSLPDTFIAATPPNVTVAPGAKPEPDMFTFVPPTVVPEPGKTDVIVGGMYVNPFTVVAADPSGFVTTTLTLPAA